MTTKKTVQLQITSECEGQQVEQNFKAELYVKGTHIYYRYNETDVGMGRTITTLKIESKQIRIIRHGEVQSEQTFTLHTHKAGFYQTPQGKLELATFTHDLVVDLSDQIGSISWSYDLFVSDELSGKYYLTVLISDN